MLVSGKLSKSRQVVQVKASHPSQGKPSKSRLMQVNGELSKPRLMLVNGESSMASCPSQGKSFKSRQVIQVKASRPSQGKPSKSRLMLVNGELSKSRLMNDKLSKSRILPACPACPSQGCLSMATCPRILCPSQGQLCKAELLVQGKSSVLVRVYFVQIKASCARQSCLSMATCPSHGKLSKARCQPE